MDRKGKGYTVANEIDWELQQQLKRDICLMYHEQSEYPSIDGDLAYHLLYTLPYWDLLDLKVHPEDREFFRDGCLVIIYAMAWDLIQGSGTYLSPWIDQCRSAVSQLQIDDESGRKLKGAVLEALDAGRADEKRKEELLKTAVWVNYTFVRGYFQKMADKLSCLHERVRDWSG